MSIYKKSGDGGVSCFGPDLKISKTSRLLDFFGELDELNSRVGTVVVALDGARKNQAWREQLVSLQQYLLKTGSTIGSMVKKSDFSLVAFEKELQKRVGQLEQEMDALEKELPPLIDFVVPGGSEISARLHLARTACRRLERVLWGLKEDKEFNELFLQDLPHALFVYFNRLSDWLYLAALLLK